ncbi:MAG: 4-hydroxythreonine-4-phosphate dehydrogenase PdxA [Candidatus Omnitrophica bacterium]|nr:4-hydroxythreonine-4-phosphate dehydrogenase PdxA [Candidatus Omnitrophota bacterium]
MNLKHNPTSKSSKLRVGITMGDPSGIGAGLILKALPKLKNLADFVIIADGWVLNKLKTFGSELPTFRLVDLNNVRRDNFSFGKVKAEYGRASIEYLDKALELVKDKAIDCLVTCPVSKEAVSLAGFKFRGHTEYLAKQTHTKDFVMLLLNKDLRIGLVTRHIPLKDVPLKINKEKILKTIFLTHKGIKEMFALASPRMVVCGLNPHASDNGLIGNEENKHIKPVIQKLRRRLRMQLDGPLPADVAIYKATRNEYDCVIAMYHDQALIPLKLYGSDTGVNMTLGLPFVRTSPLHGTAFDIARNPDLANPNSLIEAIKLAAKCTINQKKD